MNFNISSQAQYNAKKMTADQAARWCEVAISSSSQQVPANPLLF